MHFGEHKEQVAEEIKMIVWQGRIIHLNLSIFDIIRLQILELHH